MGVLLPFPGRKHEVNNHLIVLARLIVILYPKGAAAVIGHNRPDKHHLHLFPVAWLILVKRLLHIAIHHLPPCALFPEVVLDAYGEIHLMGMVRMFAGKGYGRCGLFNVFASYLILPE